MRLGFGWVWERNQCYDCHADGWLLSRRDASEWRYHWVRRFACLRHPVRARQWKQYGAALYDLFEGGPGGKFNIGFEKILGHLFDLSPVDTPFLRIATVGSDEIVVSRDGGVTIETKEEK